MFLNVEIRVVWFRKGRFYGVDGFRIRKIMNVYDDEYNFNCVMLKISRLCFRS